jgi:putative transposase
MTGALISKAMEMALNQRDTAPGLIVHSDRGTQYHSQAYIDYLTANEIRIRMAPQR